MDADESAVTLRAHIRGRILTVKVVPKAAKTEVAGMDSSGTLRVRVKAPPEKGEANAELLRFISKTLNADARLVRGAASRTKLIEVCERRKG